MNEAKLIALAEYHEGRAQAIRTTIAIWNEQEGKRAVNGFKATLAGAVKLRRGKGGLPEEEPSTSTYVRGSGKTGKVRRSAEELAQLIARAITDGHTTAIALKEQLGYTATSGVYGVLSRLKKQKVVKLGPVNGEGQQTYLLGRQAPQPQ